MHFVLPGHRPGRCLLENFLPMIRLALVDDHATVRESLREFLNTCPDLQVVV